MNHSSAGSLCAVFFNICRQATALVLAVIVSLQPLVANAQLASDSAAQMHEQPTIGAAPNGVPLVGIAPVNGAGVSHNKYQDFNIDDRGVILNNSAVVGTSVLGGVVLGNPNLAPGNEAGLIINEVTSTNPSVLGGALEVHGSRADVVVANPNGITVDGVETINIGRFSLTTGRPVLDGAGNLNRLDVGGGTITLEDLGLNAETTTQTDIIARVTEVMAAVSAGQSLNVILGRNDVDYDSLLTTVKGPNGQPKPALALDGTLFGAMQAGRIRIMATEDGVGVKTPKNLVTNLNDIVVDANGITRLKTTTAATDIRVTAPEVVIDETVHASSSLDIQASSRIAIAGTASVGAVDDVSLTAPEVSAAQGSVLAADLLANGSFGGSTGSLTVTANTYNNSGFVSGYGVDLETFTNTATGFIQATGGDLALSGTVINNGVLASANTLTFNGATLTNTEILLAENTISLIATGSITNDHGLIESLSANIAITAAALNNLGAAQVSTTTNTTYFQYSGSPPDWIQTVTGGGYWRDADDGGRASTHVFVPNPNLIDISGWSNTRWQTEAPTDAATWNTAEWAVFIPDEANPGGGRNLYVTVERDTLTSSIPGEILAENGSISINTTGNINNNNATIAAGGDITLSGTTLINTGATLTQQISLGLDYNNDTIRSWGWFFGILQPESTRNGTNNYSGFNAGDNGPQLHSAPSDQNILGRSGGSIVAGGVINGTISGDISLLNQPAADLAFGQSAGIAALQPGLDDSQKTRFRLPEFQKSTNPRYQLETRFQFIDVSTFFGSDYFLDQLSFDPDTFTKRLGDAYFDTRLISREVTRQTGLKFLNGYTTASNQMQALLDNAAAEAAALSLTPGITLSKEQVAALTQDIVWYEEEVVDGETVAVPRLYLTNPAVLAEAAALSGDAVTLVAQNFTQYTSLVQADGDIQITATGNFEQSGGTIKGQNINVTAQNIRLAADSTTVGNGQNKVGSLLNSKATITASNDISFGALNALTLEGAQLNSGNTTTLTAQDTLTITTAQQNSYFTSKTDRATITASRLENIQSSIKAGNQLTITSNTGSVALEAAELQANTVTLTGEQIAIKTATDTEYSQAILQKESTFMQSTRDAGFVDETILNTTINANTLNLNAPAITAELGVGGLASGGGEAEAIAEKAAEPGLGYLTQIPDQNIVLVRENDREWNDHSKGLSQTGAIIVTAIITVATYGAGAPLSALTAAQIAATSQATVATINNQGNLGRAFDDFATVDTAKNIAVAYATAGLTQGVNIDVGSATGNLIITEAAKSGISAGIRAGVTGEDLGEQLRQSLEFAGVSIIGNTLSSGIGSLSKGSNPISPVIQYTLHAAAGCATGALQGNCGAGALGAVVGEATGEAYLAAGGRNRDFGKALAELTSATTAALAGTGDVAIASRAGGDAAANNALGKIEEYEFRDRVAGDLQRLEAGLDGLQRRPASQEDIQTRNTVLAELSDIYAIAKAQGNDQVAQDAAYEMGVLLGGLAYKTTDLGTNTAASLYADLPPEERGALQQGFQSGLQESEQYKWEALVEGGFVAGVTARGLVKGVKTSTSKAPEATTKQTQNVEYEPNPGTLPGAVDAEAGGFSQYDQFRDRNGNWIWPSNDGFVGMPKQEILEIGTVIDRYGGNTGNYFAPVGTALPERALKPGGGAEPYGAYVVTKPLPVLSGEIKPAFGQPGLGIQYKTRFSVKQLENDEYIKILD